MIALALPLALAAVGCHQSGGGGAADAGDTDSASDVEYLEAGDLVHGIDITAIALYQGIKIPLMEDGDPAGPYPVPVIEDRDALLRVWIERQTEWKPHEVFLQVDLQPPSADPVTLQALYLPEVDSTESNLESTLNIEIPGELITDGVSYVVSLREPFGGVVPAGDTDRALWPAEGDATLTTDAVGEPIQLVVVPIRYFGDGSGRYPDTSEAQLYLYRETLAAQYPITGVETILHEPIEWHGEVLANGAGWGELLGQLPALRSADGAPSNHYYYGVFNPAASLVDYMEGGGVAGMSYLAESPYDAWARSSIGLGYYGQDSADTMVHEVGHAHGREHAPCGIGSQTPDPNYPYTGGYVGAWGYDAVNEILIDPSTYFDFMSYCSPTWTSDYTYEELYERVVAVNALGGKADGAPDGQHWVTIGIGLDGALFRGPELRFPHEPGGREQPVEWLDAAGGHLATVTGHLRSHGEPGGGLVLFPPPPADVARVRLPGHGALDW